MGRRKPEPPGQHHEPGWRDPGDDPLQHLPIMRAGSGEYKVRDDVTEENLLHDIRAARAAGGKTAR